MQTSSKVQRLLLATTVAAAVAATCLLQPAPSAASDALESIDRPTVATQRFDGPVQAPAAIEQNDIHIVLARDLETARGAVLQAGGTIVRELGIVNAVGAHLPADALRQLQRRGDVRTIANLRMTTAASKQSTRLATSTTSTSTSTTTTATANPVPAKPRQFAHADLVEAPQAHAAGVDGRGVTVAVLDTGFTKVAGLDRTNANNNRVLAEFDAIQNEEGWVEDGYGHGSHVTGIIMDSTKAADGSRAGIAPNARLVAVKAFGDDGSATYLDVLTGMNWLLENREKYDIRVLNLSFSATPSSHYWEDPVNQAVMKLWQAGIVVVAAAGNDGPVAMTVGVPGNTPYVITVGAVTDNYTLDASDDRLASFSSAGPTYEGFVKPDVVAPGGHVVGLMKRSWARIAAEHPEFQVNDNYFAMSGTSQATAVVSGVVALMLQAKPWLTPDDVKCQLMASANAAVDGSGQLAFAIFQQGAGLVNAHRAVASTVEACANRGLDVAADLAGTAHFGGYAQQDADGAYYLMGIDGFLWSRTELLSSGFLWSRSTNDSASLWSSASEYTDGFLWSRSLPFADVSTTDSTDAAGFLWSRTTGVNRWVAQE